MLANLRGYAGGLMRTKQFTRDVIDTLGNRISEIVIPLPKSDDVRKGISEFVRSTILLRIEARQQIKTLSAEMVA